VFEVGLELQQISKKYQMQNPIILSVSSFEAGVNVITHDQLIIDAIPTSDGNILLISRDEVFLKPTGNSPRTILKGRVKDAATWSSTIVLLDDGSIYLYETNTLIPINTTKTFKLICAAYGTNYAVDINDCVYKVNSSQVTPVPSIEDMFRTYNTKNIVKISGGYDQVVALTEDGYVFGCGYTGYGVIANSDGAANFNQPWKSGTFFNDQGIRIRDLQCGMFHTIFFPMTKCDYCYIVGHGSVSLLKQTALTQ
jgi:hypothetical protein